ncbi:MAG: hypothetical protein M4579_000141 [Chaenotheca gracillima]|nr:MAG: hypothetical protein M4579_000141 [Chaenotheca gracillima]
MRAIHIDRFLENYEDLHVTEVTDPRCGDDEVLVEVRAVATNYVDLLYCRGKHQNNRKDILPPFTLGLEFAGIVLSAGRHVASSSSALKPGARVFGAHLGAFAERIAVPPTALHTIPSGWTFAQAAGLAATAPVSYGALIARAGLRAGETVLVHGAAGGLGLMAVQIAKAAGARVIATASGTVKGDVARRFGADLVVDYTSKQGMDWHRVVLDATGGKGVDVVFDSVGLVGQSVRCTKERGRVLIVGFAGREEGDKIEEVAMNRFLLKQAVVIGYRWGATQRLIPEENSRVWEELTSLLEKGFVKPTVFDKSYRGLDDVPIALRDLAARKVWGKAVVRVGSEANL